jgi:hypothetical protein
MTLASTSPALGVSLASSAGSVDPFGIVRWAAIATTLGTWFPASVAFTSVGLTGAAGNITGGTAFAFTASDLGDQLATAAQSVDAAGQAAWGRIGDALVSHVQSYGLAGSSGLAYVVGGMATPVPVTGSGVVTISNLVIGPALAEAAGSVDALGIAAWTAIGSQILSWLTTNGLLVPTMTILDTGGPVTGTGSLQ